MLPQVNNVKYSHGGAVNPSGGNGFILGHNQFLDVHVCYIVCICRRPKGGWPCHPSTSLLRVLGRDYVVICSVGCSGYRCQHH